MSKSALLFAGQVSPGAILKTWAWIRLASAYAVDVKVLKKSGERKTRGTLAVEKHRPLMNRLSEEQRRRLRQRAAELLYGSKTVAAGR